MDKEDEENLTPRQRAALRAARVFMAFAIGISVLEFILSCLF